MSETNVCVHVEAYMLVSLSYNFPWKWMIWSHWDQLISFSYDILKRGAYRGFQRTPWTQTGSTTAYTCMLMHRHSGYIIHEQATRMYFKKYMGRVVLWNWAELSYKLGLSWHGPSFKWAELAWAELVWGRVVRNSFFLSFLSLLVRSYMSITPGSANLEILIK